MAMGGRMDVFIPVKGPPGAKTAHLFAGGQFVVDWSSFRSFAPRSCGSSPRIATIGAEPAPPRPLNVP